MAALYQIALNPPPTLREANWTSDLYEFVEYVLKKEVSAPFHSPFSSHLSGVSGR